MDTNFFAGCVTVEQVKQTYHKLAMQYHPDRGGDTATMQALNAEYHDVLKSLNGRKSVSDQGDEYTYTYQQEVEQAVIDKIAEVLATGIIDATVEFWLIGTWLWVTGETYPKRAEFKALGFYFNGSHKAWCWHLGKWSGRKSGKGLAEIAASYGATRFEDEAEEKTTLRRGR